QILSPRPEKAGNRKVSGSFFVSFAQSAVFGAFFMQRMCNLGKRAKDRWICVMNLPDCFFVSYEKAILCVIMENRENMLGESNHGTKKEPMAAIVFEC
ncbi:MAG: hypothetical protein PUD16_13845, partial [bacterium]|nr:hypothetical protein [bacterium]